MSTRARFQNSNDSQSLWNYTLSPGWSAFDAHILRLAVMRYGCGSWKGIIKHFPLKTCGQLNLQTQRLFGQQALAEFNKLHIDPMRIKQINDKDKEGLRKNQCLINLGDNVSAEERDRRKQKHKVTYELPEKLYKIIPVPVVLDAPKKTKTTVDKIEKLREMYRALFDMQLRAQELKQNGGKNTANIAARAREHKNTQKKASESSKDENKNEKPQPQPSVEDANGDDVEMTEQCAEPKPVTDSDIEVVKVTEPQSECPTTAVVAADEAIDEETAMAMALSASMAGANIETPAVEKTRKTKTKSSKKKSVRAKKQSSRKRKKMSSDDDEAYVPSQPAKKRTKKK
eukprot:CAMPEP_0202684676 /NCGR_PEP_ID=MMETSP1385-20130828/223_1 /ASSEMBLY_ACC=CAM_ASM_000861 /TAXON_ID=933848 /ORGANISM="Elphidium margaritaceum" /LENGTH=342 /DNA_ID=CAMNT_0049338867 /DNA_START=89 /DNA_END=1117 /DNA_ORIENTATION=-